MNILKCDHCEKQFNKKSTFKTHTETVHVGLDINKETSSASSLLINNIPKSNNSQEMTSHYHLRRPRVPEKQKQLPKSPSV